MNQLSDHEYREYKKLAKKGYVMKPGTIAILGLFAAALFACQFLIANPAFWGAASPANSNPQTAYVPQPGDCVVLPQGQDAVYDLYYAEKVNPANCKAFLDQAQARLLDAQAMAIIDNEIKDDNQIGLGALLGAIGTIIALVLFLKFLAAILGVRS